MNEVLTVNEIKAAYPDQWVLVGNPQISVASLIAGVVIWNGKDKRDILKANVNWRDRFESATTFFTGERPKNRRFLLDMNTPWQLISQKLYSPKLYDL